MSMPLSEIMPLSAGRMNEFARKFARILAACCIAALLAPGLPSSARATSDIGENAAITIAARELSRQIDAANRNPPMQAHRMTMDALLRYHTLIATRYGNPENVCLYHTLFAGLVADLEPWQKARDEDLRKKLAGRTYYLVAYEPDVQDIAFDGGRYCIYVDARSGKIIRYDALQG